MKLKSYLYTNRDVIIRIQAKKKPSIDTQRPSGTWVVNELYNNEWCMPCFPEITWGKLRTMIYLGVLNDEPKEEFVNILVNRK
jgi:hypothetical protein